MRFETINYPPPTTHTKKHAPHLINKTMVDLVFSGIASKAMESVCHRSPRSFHRKIIPHALSMKCHPQVPQACILVAATGSGKSSAYQSIGAVDGGISLIIETAISLGADQTAKIKSASSQSSPAEAFQLDSIKSACDRNSLIKFLKDMPPLSNTAAFLLSSPEEIGGSSSATKFSCIAA